MIEFLSYFKWVVELLKTLISFTKIIKNLFIPKEVVTELSTVASRFVDLFENHEVHRNQIPRFFGNGLTLNDVETNEKLLPKLTPDILQVVADLFAVRIEWLEGVDNKIYPVHEFYKHPEQYAAFLHKLNADEDHRVIAKLVWSTDSNYEQDAVLVLEEQFDYLGNESISRYHICGGWVNKYWKSRADLTACVAITLKQRGFIQSFLTSARIDQFSEGKGFVSDLYSLPYAYKRDWLFRKHYERWDPESWTNNPKAFLERVDEGDFGKTSAIERWLYYFDKGLMDTGYPSEGAYSEFERLLARYK